MERITVKEVADILKKDPNWVRAGIIEGWLPIGIATRKGRAITSISQQSSKLGRINYYIFPEKIEKLKKGVFDYDLQQQA